MSLPVQEAPKITMYRSHLAQRLRRRGLARRETGDPAGALRALAFYDAVTSRSGMEWVRDRLLSCRAGGPGRTRPLGCL
ncbi:MAG: hypothetical protein ACLQIB_23575 [Isosphaeraceae bacterium]